MYSLTLPLRLLGSAMVEEVTLPRFGSQDLGITPGGAMDCFSLRRGNRMLGNPEGSPALEMVVVPEIEILEPCFLVLTGACLAGTILRHGHDEHEIQHSGVFRADPGDCLRPGRKTYGFRTYLCLRRLDDAAPPTLRVIPFAQVGGWVHPQGAIRIVPGPECDWLEHPERFWETAWLTSPRMDRMGIRLEGGEGIPCRRYDIISAAVADGTVQMTTEGPIVLLRHRQTTGGYPRIFNVISADVDLLGQYGPRQTIRFQPVTEAEARAVAARKESLLQSLQPI